MPVWCMGYHKRAELCVNALSMAVARYGQSSIIHSDRDSQYTSKSYRFALNKHKIAQSMGRTGSCFDNARMESFFATLKGELIHDLPLWKMTVDEVRQKVFNWVEGYYNRERLYTSNEEYLPPLIKRAKYLSIAGVA